MVRRTLGSVAKIRLQKGWDVTECRTHVYMRLLYLKYEFQPTKTHKKKSFLSQAVMRYNASRFDRLIIEVEYS
jgi:hypothetical protein